MTNKANKTDATKVTPIAAREKEKNVPTDKMTGKTKLKNLEIRI